MYCSHLMLTSAVFQFVRTYVRLRDKFNKCKKCVLYSLARLQYWLNSDIVSVSLFNICNKYVSIIQCDM